MHNSTYANMVGFTPTYKDPDTGLNKANDNMKKNVYIQNNTVVQTIQHEWSALRQQLLQQWPRLTLQEIDYAGPRRDMLAGLIQKKYGIKARLAENYLCNFERILPFK